jgi:hypothetical protein
MGCEADPQRGKDFPVENFPIVSPHNDSDSMRAGIFFALAAPEAEKNPADSEFFARVRGARFATAIWPASCDIPRGTFSARRVAPIPSVITVEEGRL